MLRKYLQNVFHNKYSFHQNYLIIIFAILLLQLFVVEVNTALCQTYNYYFLFHGNVKDKDTNLPVEGVTLQASVYYAYVRIENEHEFYGYETKTKIATTDNSGYYNVTINLGENLQQIITREIVLNDVNYLLHETSAQEINDTEFKKEFHIMKIVDLDKNGIHDDFEWELLKKFCPSLTANVTEPYLLPNQVQIMGGKYNTEIYVTMVIDNKVKHEFYKDRNVVPIRADLIQYSGPDMKFINIMKPGTWGEHVDIANKEILNLPLNPIPLHFTDYLRIQSNPSAPYQTKLVALIMDDDMMPDYDQYTPVALYVHYNLPGSTPGEWWRAYSDIPMRLNDTVYGTMWKEGNTIAIQYWFFYAYNDWKNDHEGDWEHINVILTSQFPEQPTIDKVQFYFHTRWKEWKPEDLKFEDNTHVKVYIGGSYEPSTRNSILHAAHNGHLSNASYPDKVVWENAGGEGDHDKVHGRGIQSKWYFITDESDRPDDGSGLELIKDPNYLLKDEFFTRDSRKNSHYLWLLTDIFWGEPGNNPQNNGIVYYHGPTFKAGW